MLDFFRPLLFPDRVRKCLILRDVSSAFSVFSSMDVVFHLLLLRVVRFPSLRSVFVVSRPRVGSGLLAFPARSSRLDPTDVRSLLVVGFVF